MRILLVEDDRKLADYVRRSLEEEHHTVSVCFDGASGLAEARKETQDAIVLDVMMPVMDGLEVTRRIRADRIRTPIILLTARDAPEDIVRGLTAGADDYVTKPFSLDVLVARIQARTRTSPDAPGTILRFADLSMDLETREVRRGKTPLKLTRTEFAILECLLRSSGRIVTRERLMDAVWGDREVGGNNVDVFISFLRAKVDPPKLPKLIHTERGVGYTIQEGEC
ncbi:MAG TPA: response regulator transcription factor [Terriglobia bacterium]|nr:response regulator transcription factor [Terriglobia bacterium]